MILSKTPLKTAVREYEKAYGGFVIGTGKQDGLQGRASKCKNCACEDGVLRVGVGLRAVEGALGDTVPLPVNLPAAQAFFTRRERTGQGNYTEKYAMITQSGTVYEYDESMNAWTKRLSFGEQMTPITAFAESRDFVCLFAGASGVYEVNATGAVKTGLARASTVACFYKSRVFCAVKPFSIAYSAPFAPTDFAESIHDGGEVCLLCERGEIVALVPFKGKLCILYERGIAFLSLAGTAREFAFEEVAYHGGAIVGASAGVAAVGGEKLFFLADDGVYCFDGSEVAKTCTNLEILPNWGIQVCNHAEFDGKYFAVFYDRDGVKRGLVLDSESGEGYYAFTPEGVCVVDGEAWCFADGKLQKLCVGGALPANEACSFQATTGFDAAGLKTLKALTFYGEGAFAVEVESVRGERRGELTAQNGEATLKVGLRGEAFTIRVALQKGARLHGVRARLQRLDGLK